MKTILAHGRYEVLLGEERVSYHPLGDPLQLVFSADEVTAVSIHQGLAHAVQRLAVRCLDGA